MSFLFPIPPMGVVCSTLKSNILYFILVSIHTGLTTLIGLGEGNGVHECVLFGNFPGKTLIYLY